MRGYRLINVVTVVAEIGDPRRFSSPRPLMAFLGTVPSQHSTGNSITKTGNGRARKALIEAAWTYTRHIRAASATSTHRSAAVRAIAENVRHRLSGRYRRLVARQAATGGRRSDRPRIARLHLGHRPRRHSRGYQQP
jgi:transposase